MKIFLFHGIGEHRDGWERHWIDALSQAWTSLGLDQTHFDRRFQFIPVSYDFIFRQKIEKWSLNRAQFDDVAGGLLPGVVGRIADYVSDPSRFDNPVFSHGADLLL